MLTPERNYRLEQMKIRPHERGLGRRWHAAEYAEPRAALLVRSNTANNIRHQSSCSRFRLLSLPEQGLLFVRARRLVLFD